MDELIPFLGHWVWWVVAGALLLLELTAPGVFFIWLAIAAAAVAVIDLVLPMNWQMELLVFAVFAVVSVFAGRSLLKGRRGDSSDSPHLNQRMAGYVGRSVTLEEPIADGRGRINLEGTLWEVRGPDAPKGAHVRVTGTDGMRLTVEKA